jgi:NDP-sugar pyrophosphorylase family protein
VSDSLPTVCILAGGLGTRLGALSATTPKSLQRVAGELFIRHQLRQLADAGATRVVVCVGHLGDQIEAALGERDCGVQLRYRYDASDAEGTLGAVRGARDLLGDRFLILYGDTYLRVDFGGFAGAWAASGRVGAMAVLHNRGAWDRSNATYVDGLVTRYNKGADNSAGLEWIDYGLSGLKAAALDRVPADTRDLATLFATLSTASELFGFPVDERFYEIGTPESLRETDAYLSAHPIAPADKPDTFGTT